MHDYDFDDDIAAAAESYDDQEKVYSVMQWFGTFLLMFIPVVNIILLFVWAFSNKINKNKKNWAIASLFIVAIVAVLLIILYFMLVSMFNRIFSE
ncbi:MAG TPA: hypothetical protein VIL05_03560 [Thermoclostridium sp.]